MDQTTQTPKAHVALILTPVLDLCKMQSLIRSVMSCVEVPHLRQTMEHVIVYSTYMKNGSARKVKRLPHIGCHSFT